MRSDSGRAVSTTRPPVSCFPYCSEFVNNGNYIVREPKFRVMSLRQKPAHAKMTLPRSGTTTMRSHAYSLLRTIMVLT